MAAEKPKTEAQRQTALEVSQQLREQMLDTYYALCDQRDAAYKRAAPLEKKLAAAIEATQKAQAVERELAAAVEEAWGPDHLQVKREIARLANALRFAPQREGSPAPQDRLAA